jgi:glycerol-3-phosphate O-acyltransferase / dihydroxyacetone phosphate acyltransferase
MNPILLLIYRFLQALAVVSLRIYFRKIVYINRQYLTAKPPFVAISNHPNTVVDPLLALMYLREPCFVLANYSLFKNPIAGAILRTLFCIPVKRAQDVVAGEVRNNNDAFRASGEHLAAGRCLFVAPEGSSFTERHIREFKTGTARIVLEAESKTDFAIDLKILPIGLTYFDPLKFGSDVVVEVGEPFSADDWKAQYAANPRQTADDFTTFIEQKFHNLTIHCTDVQEDHFLQKVEAVVQSENPLDTEGGYFRSKELLKFIQNWKTTNPISFKVFEQDVETYFSQLNNLKIKDVNTKKTSVLDSLSLIILGTPMYILGFIPNFIPAWLSNSLVKWLKIDSAYDTTIRYLSGLLFFPILWWLETVFIFRPFLPTVLTSRLWFLRINDLNVFQTILLIWGYIAFGLAAWHIHTEGLHFFNFQKYKRANADGSLTKLRQPILDKLTDFITN